MKRAALAVLVAAALFAATAFAATPAPAPIMPSDLATAWTSVDSGSCKKPDGVVIELKLYEKKDASAFVGKFTKNDEFVAFYEITGTSDSVSVKQADGSWKKYDRMVEQAEGLAAVVSAIGLTPQKFNACVRK